MGEATIQFGIVASSFPNDPCAHEAHYYLGVAYYYLEEYEFSNDALSDYLKAQSHPVYFEEAIQYKYAIAEAFRCGAKRRLLSMHRCPKWAEGKEQALAIYDEVIAALPSQDIATQALFSKGCLLMDMKEYCESVEAFRMFIRRFPKHELAPESYLAITAVYLKQSCCEFQNPDILALAEINLRKFKQDFPREERIALAEEDVMSIKEPTQTGYIRWGSSMRGSASPLLQSSITEALSCDFLKHPSYSIARGASSASAAPDKG